MRIPRLPPRTTIGPAGGSRRARANVRPPDTDLLRQLAYQHPAVLQHGPFFDDQAVRFTLGTVELRVLGLGIDGCKWFCMCHRLFLRQDFHNGPRSDRSVLKIIPAKNAPSTPISTANPEQGNVSAADIGPSTQAP